MTDKFGRAIGGSSVSSVNTGVTKGYIRVNYLESNMEEDIDMKNQFKIKKPSKSHEVTRSCYKILCR